MFTLPEDIVFTEILPRISSVKSLLKFKSVSKSWCSLISSEYFVKTQLQTSSAKSTSGVMLSMNDRCFAVGCYDVDVLFSQHDISVNQFDIDYPLSSNYMNGVAGCCNGLYCVLLAQKHFILLNPCTRKYHKLPPSAYEPPWGLTCGYGEYNGDYKVFIQFWSNPSRSVVSKLYSLKTNSWKTVQGPDIYYDSYKGIFLNGKLHWAIRTGSYPHLDLKIKTFDLGSEMVGLVEPPRFAHGECLDRKSMSVIQGCLCLVHCNSVKVTNIWVMKEYGVKKSWCKVLTLPNFGQDFVQTYKVPIPICISHEGEVLVGHRRRFLIYNPITESHKYLKVNKLMDVLDIGIGIQSFVSPFPRDV